MLNLLVKCYNRGLMSSNNPCVQCGACCAFFRVSFYWEETSPENSGVVPTEYTEPVDQFRQCMKGTNHPRPRCVALQGKIGEKVGCSIYQLRSSVCRDFGLHEEGGKIRATSLDLVRCNQARKAWHLPPITRAHLRALSHLPAIRHAPGIRNQVIHKHHDLHVRRMLPSRQEHPLTHR
jgi:Fe-S-cluster containining protein